MTYADDDFGYADKRITTLEQDAENLAKELTSVTQENQKIQVIIDAADQLLKQWESGDDQTLKQAAVEMRAVMVAASVLYHPRGTDHG